MCMNSQNHDPEHSKDSKAFLRHESVGDRQILFGNSLKTLASVTTSWLRNGQSQLAVINESFLTQ